MSATLPLPARGGRPPSRGWVVLAALLLPAGASLAQLPSRHAEAVAAKVALQRDIGAWLETTLRGLAHPYRVLVSVQLVTREDQREIVQKESQPDTVMKVGANKTVKLPGLPLVDKPLGGYGAPDISVTVPGKQKVEVRQELKMVIERTVVHLFVEKGIPPPRLDQLKKAASELLALDPGRGDALEVSELASSSQPGPAFFEANSGLLLLCATALLCALFIAIGLSRRREGSASARLVGEISAREAQPSPEKGAPALAEAPPPEMADAPRPFAFFRGVDSRQVAEALAALDAGDCAAALERAELEPESQQALFDLLPPDRQLALARVLARPRVLSTERLAAAEEKARAALAEVQSRVRLGGEAAAADSLSAVTPEVQARLLEQLSKDDPALGQAIRRRMVLFDDLGQLPQGTVRQIVTSIDPATVALALEGAPAAARENVLRSVSSRLKGILAAEAGGVLGKPASEVDAARKKVERVMRRLHSQGQLGRGRT
ncbi:MAG: hypothetical protein HYZ28_08075 [Myxococcales bacterium]|nr:hypothetical protein [Myxococcales bacterium]